MTGCRYLYLRARLPSTRALIRRVKDLPDGQRISLGVLNEGAPP